MKAFTAFCGCTWDEKIPGEYVMTSFCPGHEWARAQGYREYMKVSYRTHHGYDTKAYITKHPHPGNGFHYGTNKHTDLPVRLRWDDEADTWIEERA